MDGSLMKVRDDQYQRDSGKTFLWSIAVSLQYCFNPNLGGGGGGGVISPLLVSYNNSETLNAVTLYAAVSNISLETSVPNLIFLTSPNLQILGKILTGVFPISGFSVNSL